MNKNSTFKIEYAIVGGVISLLIYLSFLIGAFSPITLARETLFGDLESSILKTNREIEGFWNALFHIPEIVDSADNVEKITSLRDAEIVTLRLQIIDLEKQMNQKSNLNQYNYIVARVRYYPENGKEVIINKGTSSGLKENSIVVWNIYPVGIVTKVSNESSVVKLLSAADNNIPVVILGTDYKGLLKYEQESGFVVYGLPVNYVFKEGQEVVTSGFNSEFPYGLFIGKTTKLLSSKSEVTARAKVGYPVNLFNLTEVFCINN